MRRILNIQKYGVGTVVMMAIAILLMGCHKKQAESASSDTVFIDTTSLAVMQIQKCSRLYTTEMHVHKVITHDDQLAMKGRIVGHDYNIQLPLGKRKIAIPVDATIKAYVDFSSFSPKSVKRDSSHIAITLPDPRIVLTDSRIDHNGIREYVALTRRNFSDEELADYERQGRDAIIADIASTDIIERARVSAANTLIPLLQKLGYRPENITVNFSRDFSKGDIMQPINKSTVEHAKKQ